MTLSVPDEGYSRNECGRTKWYIYFMQLIIITVKFTNTPTVYGLFLKKKYFVVQELSLSYKY